MTSTMLLMVLMVGVFIRSSQAVKCYSCSMEAICGDDQSSWPTCTGDVCVKVVGEAHGTFTTSSVLLNADFHRPLGPIARDEMQSPPPPSVRPFLL